MTDKIMKKTGEIYPGLAKINENNSVVSSETNVLRKENNFEAEIASMMHKAGTVKLTEKQKDILYAKVDERDVEIRPDGLVYLPWMEYETRLRKAFGLGYALIPQGLPKLENNLVLWGHWLIIQGCPMGFSFGQQEYFPNNYTMTYGDAIEGAKSNVLMRLCKGIGISLELWKPSWVRKWKAKYATYIWGKNKRTGKDEKIWSKKEEEKIFVADKGVVPQDENPEDKNIVTEEMQEEMNKAIIEDMAKRDKIAKATKKPQNAPESTQKKKPTPTSKKETKETEPLPTEQEVNDKVIEFAQEITGEEIPYICNVKDGLSDAQFSKIKEIYKSHYLSDEEHRVLQSYLLNGRMTKVEGIECIDYFLARLRFYHEFERELIKGGVLKDSDMAHTVLTRVIQDFADTDKVKENKSQYIEAMKKLVKKYKI